MGSRLLCTITRAAFLSSRVHVDSLLLVSTSTTSYSPLFTAIALKPNWSLDYFNASLGPHHGAHRRVHGHHVQRRQESLRHAPGPDTR